MTKDDALRIALNALLGCTYDERMRAIGAVKDALSGGETAAEAPAGPSKVRNPRMWAVVKANGQVSKLRGTRQAAEKCRDDYNTKYAHIWGEATIAAFTRLEGRAMVNLSAKQINELADYIEKLQKQIKDEKCKSTT